MGWYSGLGERMSRRILIIGGNAAGVNAANSARKTDSSAEITIIEKEKYSAYSRCGIPFALGGEVPQLEDLQVFPSSHYSIMKIDLRLETTARLVDPKEKTVSIEEKNGKTESIKYDSLILATGASPFLLPIKGHNLPGVFPIRTIEDGRKIAQFMDDSKGAVIIGAGFIGLEAAHALSSKNIKTVIVELMPQVIPTMFDPDMARIVQRRIEEHGVEVMVNSRVTEILGDDKVVGVRAEDREIPAEIVIMATGVRPDVGLAQSIGCEIGVTRGIRVSMRMETSVPGVYAAGDCVESQNRMTGKPCLIQLGTCSVRQGKTAGINAAGGYATYPGAMASAVSKFFDIEVGGVGLMERAARSEGFQTVSGSVSGKTRAEYFPGGKEIRVKLIAEPTMGRILGGQIIGGEEVTQRVNMLSVAIERGMSVWDLAKADTAYAPPLAETWEPVALAAEVTTMRIRR